MNDFGKKLKEAARDEGGAMSHKVGAHMGAYSKQS